MKKYMAVVISLGLLTSCAMVPDGQTVGVSPGYNKSAEAYQGDMAFCRDYASTAVSNGASHDRWMQALIAGGGTVLGAGLGAAIGGGQGAAIGAGGGALAGTAGAGFKNRGDQADLQTRYNTEYIGCMQGRGNHASMAARDY